MKTKTKKAGGSAPSRKNLVQMFLSFKKKTNAVWFDFFLALAAYKSIAVDWVETKRELKHNGGPDWPMAKFEVGARIGAGTLPLDIWGRVIWTKLTQMTFNTAVDLLSAKRFKVRSDPNTRKTVYLKFSDMNEDQQGWLIGVDGSILPTNLQVCPAIPKVVTHTAEGCQVLKSGEFASWYHNQRGRKKIILVPMALFKAALRVKGK